MPHINCIIVEDEPMLQAAMQALVNARAELQLVAIHDNTSGLTRKYIEENDIKLVWLDNHLRGSTEGIAWQTAIDGGHFPKIIMVSAYREYQTESADRTNFIDFIPKPVTPTRFALAMERVLRDIPMIETLPRIAITHSSKNKEAITIELLCDEVLYLCTNTGERANCVYIHTKTKRYETTSPSTLEAWLERLPAHFIQVNKSFVINRKCIVGTKHNELVFDNDEDISVSKKYYQGDINKLKIFVA
jgi:DNA-binding LytR/AlgR family response regulator